MFRLISRTGPKSINFIIKEGLWLKSNIFDYMTTEILNKQIRNTLGTNHVGTGYGNYP